MTKPAEASALKDVDNVTHAEFIRKKDEAHDHQAQHRRSRESLHGQPLQMSYIRTPSFTSVQHR